MSYLGGKSWQQPATRVRRATKRKPSTTKAAKKSRRASAPAAKKKRTASASRRKPTPKRRTSSAPKRSKPAAKAKAKKITYVSRYNPATNRKTKVPKGSVEDLTWPHRKPAKTVSGLLSQSVDLANQPGGSTAAAVDYLKGKVLTKVEKKAVLTLKKAAAKGSAVAASIIGEAAGVSGSALVAASLAALAAGVGLGLATIYGADNQRDLLTRQYHEALHAVARVTSDPATAKKAMAKIKAKYLESLARIGAADPTIGIRPGME